MAITTSSSIKVNPRRICGSFIISVPLFWFKANAGWRLHWPGWKRKPVLIIEAGTFKSVPAPF
jgi:hypothetical protein